MGAFNFRVDAKDQEERKAETRGWRGVDKKTKRGQAIRITTEAARAQREEAKAGRRWRPARRREPEMWGRRPAVFLDLLRSSLVSDDVRDDVLLSRSSDMGWKRIPWGPCFYSVLDRICGPSSFKRRCSLLGVTRGSYSSLSPSGVQSNYLAYITGGWFQGTIRLSALALF